VCRTAQEQRPQYFVRLLVRLGTSFGLEGEVEECGDIVPGGGKVLTWLRELSEGVGD